MPKAASGSEIGEIRDIREKMSMKWDIPNYISLPQKADNYFDSPTFSFSDTKWRLRIFPNGQRKSQSTGWIDLCLYKDDNSSDCKVTFTLSVKADKHTIESYTGDYNFGNGHGYGWNKFCKRDKLLAQLKKKHAPEGTLTVFCEASLTSVAESGSQTSPDSTTALIHDFENLLLSGEESDVTIKVQNCAFKVHKLILMARAPFFSAKLDQHMLGKKANNVFKIADCDASTFQELLQYIYSGKVDSISRDNVIRMYVAAYKFYIEGLKEKCVDFMKADLCVATVCDVIVVADKYSEINLKKSATELLLKNIKAILPTDKWKSLLVKKYALSVELLMNAIPEDTHPSEAMSSLLIKF